MTHLVQPEGLLDLPYHVLAKLEHMDIRYQVDIGDGHWVRFLQWAPGLKLNPQYFHLAHLLRTQPVVGAIVVHRCKTESGYHEGAIYFRTELTEAGKFANLWDVKCWAPLHVEPSLLSHCPCNDHGFIRGGRWIRA